MMVKGKVRTKGNLKTQLKSISSTSVVVDSNLLILYLVGVFDPSQIDKYDATKGYGVKQFDLLLKVLSSYRKIILTQPVLAETTNHLDKLNRRTETVLYKNLIPYILKFEEPAISTENILNGTAFPQLGFADSSLGVLSKHHVILTDDDDLYGHIISKSGKAIFWRHLNPRDY